jgi:hypothetical protein
VGVYFVFIACITNVAKAMDEHLVRAEIIAVNEPKTLRLLSRPPWA